MAHITAPLSRVHYPQTNPQIVAKRQVAKAVTDSQPVSDPAADFRALFTYHPPAGSVAAPPAPPAPPPAPTPESTFGASPFVANPMGRNPNGTLFGYNPIYFATADAAAQVASVLGGKVVETNEFTSIGSPFVQQQPNQMVQMPDGRMINAGLVAAFYTHGYSQSYINGLIAQQINGTNA